MKSAFSLFMALALGGLAACYGAREPELPADSANAAGANGAAGTQPRGSDDAYDRQPVSTTPSSTTRTGGSTPPQPTPPRPDAGGGGVGGSVGRCGAFRTPENDLIYIDQDAFSGIGGAGAELAGTCKRCGWSSYGDMCQELVALVPTIQNPNYYPCLDLSLQFAQCLELESCVCGGDIPARCAAIRAHQDTCLEFGSDGSDAGI